MKYTELQHFEKLHARYQQHKNAEKRIRELDAFLRGLITEQGNHIVSFIDAKGNKLNLETIDASLPWTAATINDQCILLLGAAKSRAEIELRQV